MTSTSPIRNSWSQTEKRTRGSHASPSKTSAPAICQTHTFVLLIPPLVQESAIPLEFCRHYVPQMPRLSPALIRQATSENPLLTHLLQVCRDLPSARNELRWLREHARDAVNAKRHASRGTAAAHGRPGLKSPQEKGRTSADSIILDHAEIKESYITSKPMHTRDVDAGRLNREHDTLTHDAVTKKDETRPDRRTLIRKRKIYTNDPLIRKHAVHTVDGGAKPFWKGISAAAPSKVRYRRTASFRMKMWSPEGTRISKLSEKDGKVSARNNPFRKLLAGNVDKRSQGMPLQYILGNQPFGSLDILCRRDVLIPRPDTEIYTEKVAKLLVSFLTDAARSAAHGHQSRKKFRILDLCTGTGCIALLLHSILKPPGTGMPTLPLGMDIEILGVDFNATAVELAKKNLDRNIGRKHLHPDAAHSVSFQRLDVLALAGKIESSEFEVRRILNAAAAAELPERARSGYNSNENWDMVIANPPYIGPKDYEIGGKTESSVRVYEPKDALVPVADGRFLSSAVKQADLFYWPLTRIAQVVHAQLLVMEVGDSSQAERVGKQIILNNLKASQRSSRLSHETMPFSVEAGARLEVWRDDEVVRVLPVQSIEAFEKQFAKGIDEEVSERAVVVWSGPMTDWRFHNLPATETDRLAVPAPASNETKAELKRRKDAARQAREALKQDRLQPKPRESVPKETKPKKIKNTPRSHKQTFPPSFWESALQDASNEKVALTPSQHGTIGAMTLVLKMTQQEADGETVHWTPALKQTLNAMWLIYQRKLQQTGGEETASTPKNVKLLRAMRWRANISTVQTGVSFGGKEFQEVLRSRARFSETRGKQKRLKKMQAAMAAMSARKQAKREKMAPKRAAKREALRGEIASKGQISDDVETMAPKMVAKKEALRGEIGSKEQISDNAETMNRQSRLQRRSRRRNTGGAAELEAYLRTKVASLQDPASNN